MKDIFQGKTILITGGTGFLGRALIKKLLSFEPHAIRIFSRDEVKHYHVEKKFQDDRLRFLIGDVRDLDRLKKAMDGVDYVIHAAAMKRLDMIEYNPEESVKTNIQGTINAVHAAEYCGVKKFIFVSTDKACAPVNTYGGCKFVAERIVTEHNYSNGDSESIFASVRYGNVINSTGSIVPFLIERIKQGLDFPLTDERMTRFLITEEQAVELIMKAFQYAIGGEVFIPQLPSVKIPDLMKAMKEINNTDNSIRKIGLRPGEKIDELMVNDMEGSRVVEFDNMYIIRSMIDKYKTTDYPGSYLELGKPSNIGAYSSSDAVISKEEIVEKFKEFLLVPNT